MKALHTVGSSISLLTTHELALAHVHGNELRLRLRGLAGLNDSVIAAAVFDGQNQQRAYAVTTDLELLQLQISDQGRREVKVGLSLCFVAAVCQCECCGLQSCSGQAQHMKDRLPLFDAAASLASALDLYKSIVSSLAADNLLKRQ